MIDGRPAHAEIAVDHVNIRLMPAELAGAVLQRVLQAKALLVGQHFVGWTVERKSPPAAGDGAV